MPAAAAKASDHPATAPVYAAGHFRKRSAREQNRVKRDQATVRAVGDGEAFHFLAGRFRTGLKQTFRILSKRVGKRESSEKRILREDEPLLAIA